MDNNRQQHSKENMQPRPARKILSEAELGRASAMHVPGAAAPVKAPVRRQQPAPRNPEISRPAPAPAPHEMSEEEMDAQMDEIFGSRVSSAAMQNTAPVTARKGTQLARTAVPQTRAAAARPAKARPRASAASQRLTPGRVIRRIGLCLLTLILFLVISVYAIVFSVAHGPSKTFRNALVLSAKQASATKWVPSLFMTKSTVDSILEEAQAVTVEQVGIDEYAGGETDGDDTEDEWAKSTDGVLYETVNGSTYKGYILLVRDPSQVYVATSSNFVNATAGMTLFKCVERENCLAAINGGEFADKGGMGTGATPMGLTYSKGEKVWDDGYKRTFMGFDRDNKLVVAESMTTEQAESLGIRDAVCFQTGNVLIDNVDGNVNFYYSDGNTATSQRTAIGQRADGTVIMLVTDGRSTSSLGATRNDVIDIMVKYGAVSAAMLDGGSSAMMYYKDYAAKYGLDESSLDDYQKQGMVNKYKAFTTPRYIPTYFCVKGE